jgi:hypothetical protein
MVYTNSREKFHAKGSIFDVSVEYPYFEFDSGGG